MRLITCEYQHNTYLGVVQDNYAVLPALADEALNDMLALIAAGPEGWQRYRASIPRLPASCRIPLERVRILAPIPRPRGPQSKFSSGRIERTERARIRRNCRGPGS